MAGRRQRRIPLEQKEIVAYLAGRRLFRSGLVTDPITALSSPEQAALLLEPKEREAYAALGPEDFRYWALRGWNAEAERDAGVRW